MPRSMVQHPQKSPRHCIRAASDCWIDLQQGCWQLVSQDQQTPDGPRLYGEEQQESLPSASAAMSEPGAPLEADPFSGGQPRPTATGRPHVRAGSRPEGRLWSWQKRRLSKLASYPCRPGNRCVLSLWGDLYRAGAVSVAIPNSNSPSYQTVNPTADSEGVVTLGQKHLSFHIHEPS